MAHILELAGAAAAGLSNIVEDTTPELGGDLDALTNRIYSSSGPLNLGASASTSHSLGTGGVLVGGEFEVDGESYFDDSVGIGTSTITAPLTVDKTGGGKLAEFGTSVEQDDYISVGGDYVQLGYRDEALTIQTKNNKNIRFSHNVLGAFGTGTDLLWITPTGNLGISTLTFGTNFAGGIGMAIGTAPTTSPADMAQMWVDDITAGNAAFHFRTENDAIIKLYQQSLISDPSGGTTVDSEARTAINAILDLLENNGLMANA